MSGNTDDDHSKVSELSQHDDETNMSSNGSVMGGPGSKTKGEEDREAKCMARGKFIVLFLVLGMGCIAGGLTYMFTTNMQMDDFELESATLAMEIELATQKKTLQCMDTLTAMATTMTSYVQSSSDANWPLNTFPQFEQVASSYRDVTPLSLLATTPIVRGFEKQLWELYSVAHQDWLVESYQTVLGDEYDAATTTPLPIPTVIYNVDPTTGYTTEATDSAIYMPLWQISEPPRDTQVINYNLLSDPTLQKSMDMALFAPTPQPILTPVLPVSQVLGYNHNPDNMEEDATTAVPPESIWIQPIYQSVQLSNNAQPTVVGAIVSVLSWELFFSNMVRAENQGMVIVLQNSCDVDAQAYTFELNGPDVIYMGPGDLHDRAFNDYVYTTSISVDANMEPKFKTASRRVQEDSDKYCDYMLSIYPSTQVENYHAGKNNNPAVYTSIMVLMFVVAAMGFCVYDSGVQKRQKEVFSNVARSNAIVSSLFPAEIRDRLFKGDDVDNTKLQSLVKDKQKNVEELASSHMMSPEQTTQKFRLKNYLNEDATTAENKETIKDAGQIQETKPIADLFPNTTVLFADISGFTAWSSVREPSQVFTLLETVYKAFDKTAKRRKVFKVETVGDCYVAVTGLPEPLKDHAVVMCRFARECLTQFNQLAGQLEVLLGPDTGDLAIRVGIHSGPVTAGVLRGEKSRFQLFGDTVNTAARIESSGTRNRIHLSHETAELIFQAGKHNWLRKRTDTVMAKGKGEMQTYWLLTDEELASGTNADEGAKAAAPLPIVKANAPRLAKGNLDMMDPESTLPPRVKRLVDWNVDVLKRLLKQIVARRNALATEKYDLNHPLMMKTEVNIGCDTYVLDEVTEIIRLPGYTNVKNQENPNKIQLPKEVEDQLRLYVSSIAAMHRDNPFHNFEHASHVMMSVSKLLSRIVAPDEVLKNEDEDRVDLSLHDHTYGITSDPLTQFSVVLAALIHDVDHAGVSNFQLIKENAKIATVFKNKSVAEQNSIVLAWDRLMESRFAALRSHIYGDPDELKRFRQLMVNTVMATDIFDKELQTLRKNRWDKAFRVITDTSIDSTPEDDINRKATIVIEHLIQASDVAHTMQHWHIYQKWNERLFAEMTVAFQSGRMEKNPADGWYQGELGFFDNYVIPLAKKLKECGVFGVSSDEYLNYALENRREWSTKGEDAVKRMIEKYQAETKEEEEKKEGEKPKEGAPAEEAKK